MGAHVCLFTDSLAPSGVGQHMLTLAEELQDRYHLSFLCPPGPGGTPLLERAANAGLEAEPLEVRGESSADAALQRFLGEREVDVFHVHAGITWEGHACVAAAAGHVPAIVRTEHLAELPATFATEDLPDLVYSPYHLPDRRPGIEELEALVARDRAAYLEMAERVDRIICVSAGVRDSYAEVGVDPRKLRVVRNGIRPTPTACSREAVRERLGLSLDRPVVLSVGRMIDVKGHLFTLRAIAEVVRRRPDVLFVWVGGGPLEDELRRRVRDLGLQESVWFAGQREDVPDLICSADLFLLASMVEGLPLVVLEAMAAGRPVVATRVCGTSEVVQDGVTGRLVESGRLDGSGDTAALTAAILEPLEDPDLAAAWGSAGRALFESEFTCARMARETAAIYDELIARPRLPLQHGGRLTRRASAGAPR